MVPLARNQKWSWATIRQMTLSEMEELEGDMAPGEPKFRTVVLNELLQDEKAPWKVGALPTPEQVPTPGEKMAKDCQGELAGAKMAKRAMEGGEGGKKKHKNGKHKKEKKHTR